MTTTEILKNVFRRENNLSEAISLEKKSTPDYLNFISRQMLSSDVPVKPSVASWETFDYGDYTCIEKKYNFGSFHHLLYFVNEVLTAGNRLSHDPNLSIVGLDIDVKLYTHDINDVTDADLKLSKIIDEIFEDIFYIEEL